MQASLDFLSNIQLDAGTPSGATSGINIEGPPNTSFAGGASADASASAGAGGGGSLSSSELASGQNSLSVSPQRNENDSAFLSGISLKGEALHGSTHLTGHARIIRGGLHPQPLRDDVNSRSRKEFASLQPKLSKRRPSVRRLGERLVNVMSVERNYDKQSFPMDGDPLFSPSSCDPITEASDEMLLSNNENEAANNNGDSDPQVTQVPKLLLERGCYLSGKELVNARLTLCTQGLTPFARFSVLCSTEEDRKGLLELGGGDSSEDEEDAAELERNKILETEISTLLVPTRRLEWDEGNETCRVIEESLTYHPEHLDDPGMRSSKDRTIMRMKGRVASVLPFVSDSELKKDINNQFADRHEGIVSASLTLTKIRAIKKLIVEVCREEDLELSTAALAHYYFECLILNPRKIVVKANRRLLGAVCLLLAVKLNENPLPKADEKPSQSWLKQAQEQGRLETYCQCCFKPRDYGVNQGDSGSPVTPIVVNEATSSSGFGDSTPSTSLRSQAIVQRQPNRGAPFNLLMYKLLSVQHCAVVCNGCIEAVRHRTSAVYGFKEARPLFYSSLFDRMEDVFEMKKKEILSEEWAVLIALEFSLHPEMHSILPHFQRILAGLDMTPAEYLGSGWDDSPDS